MLGNTCRTLSVSVLMAFMLSGLPSMAHPQETEVAERSAATGAIWHVTEDGGWTGTWTQRGTSQTFDAVWTRGSQRVTGILTMRVEGRHIRIQSRRQSNGSDVDYQGSLSPDGRSISGTLHVLGRSGTAKWKARIDPANQVAPSQAAGRVWHVTEDGGWTGTWTRRGSTHTFDGVWTRGGQGVTGVLTMTVEGRRVRIQSRKQSNGADVDYEGSLSADGRSISGSLHVLGRSGSASWRARIDR